MKTIKEHIKKNEYAPVYLLHGEEGYLKELYKNKLKKAILGDSDEVNYTCFKGKGIDASQVKEIADNPPFFAERRLILIEDSGWFKGANEFAGYLPSMPETTHIVFVEQDVDKRNKLYKYVAKSGVEAVMDAMGERELVLWAAGLCKQGGKAVRENTIRYLLEHVNTNMNHLQNEIEKLIAYTEGREEITTDDIDSICTMQITNRIFPMIDAVGEKNRKKALQLYYDLLALRENPMSVLFLLSRHFNILLQVKEQEAKRTARELAAKKIGIPPFTVKKYAAQAAKFRKNQLIEAVSACISSEEAVKTGRIGEQLAVELLLLELAG